MQEKRDPIKFDAQVLDIYKPRRDQLTAAAHIEENALISKSKPRFCALLLLARLSKRNGNGHRLPLDHTKNAIAALGDKPFIMADLNHRTGGKGTSTRIWIDEAGDYPLLMLEALFWSRAFTNEEIENIKAEHQKENLGASWEIDWPYELVAAEDEPDTFDVTNFGLSGFCLTVGVEPAEEATKGSVTITATKGGDDVGDEEFWNLYEKILYEREDIVATLIEEEPDQDFLERFFYELDNDSLEAAKLTYQQRKDLSDSDFAYVKTVKGKSGKTLKVRRFPIHDEAHRRNAVARLPQAKGLDSSEKAAIFRKCLAKGRSDGDAWVEKYAGWDTSVYPPRKPAKADLEGASKVMEAWPGDDFMAFLRGIRCPVCGERYGRVRKADLDKGKFLMECGGNNPDREEHNFSVSIVVEATGKNAIYAVMAVDGEPDSNELMLKMIEEVNTMAEPIFTPEQKAELGTIADAAVQKALSEQKDSAEAKAKAEKDKQKEIDDAVAAKLAEERDKAVKDYKEKRKLGASRADEIGKILAYESDEAKEEAIELLAEMSQEDYEKHKSDKEKDKELAELRAQVKGEKPAEEGSKEKDLNAAKDKDKPRPDFKRF